MMPSTSPVDDESGQNKSNDNYFLLFNMNGNQVLWRKTYQQSMEWLRSAVLDCVPKENENQKFGITNVRQTIWK